VAENFHSETTIVMTRNNRNKLLIMGCLLAFAIVMSIYAHRLSYFPGDLRLTLLLQSFYSDSLLSTMKSVSFAFTSWRAALMVIIAVVLVWRYWGKSEGILVAVAGLLSLLDSPIKDIIARPRPSPELVHIFITEQNYSFPSGHALFSILVLGILVYLIASHLRQRNLRILSSTILIALVLLVGTSRVYLGIHWPSDVIGGYLIGGIFLTALIWSYGTWKDRLR
jgi:undecaprenyl-diphosphatase